MLHHSLLKHMVRKHYYNFRSLTNMLKISLRGFDHVQNCNVNPLNVPKCSDANAARFLKCFKISKVYLTILGHYAL